MCIPTDIKFATGRDSKTLVLETWDECCRLLPKSVAENLAAPSGDPRMFKKRATNIVRLRVLPRLKSPLNFWSGAWCFYELGVGVYDGALNVGGVQFVQFPFQKVCGSSHYWRSVIDVFKGLANGRADGFHLLAAAGPGSATHYQRVYRPPDFPFFPVAEAAQDLAWLIQKTLPQFEALSP